MAKIVIEVQKGIVVDVYQNKKRLSDSQFEVLDWDDIENWDIADFITRNKNTLSAKVINELNDLKSTNERQQITDSICDILDDPKNRGFEKDIISSALIGLKNNPDWSIAYALSYGVDQCIK